MADEISFKVDIKDFSKEIEKVLDKDIERCLYAMGVLAVEGAVTAISTGETAAVDTGRLRASISFVTAGGQRSGANVQIPKAGQTTEKNPLKSGDELSGKAPKADSVIVGTNVEYAEYVHNGVHKRKKDGKGMAARPFLRVGIDNKREEMKEKVKGILKGEY